MPPMPSPVSFFAIAKEPPGSAKPFSLFAIEPTPRGSADIPNLSSALARSLAPLWTVEFSTFNFANSCLTVEIRSCSCWPVWILANWSIASSILAIDASRSTMACRAESSASLAIDCVSSKTVFNVLTNPPSSSALPAMRLKT